MKDNTVIKCQICGAVLGDYMTGDYFRLIRMKYCPECKIMIDRQRKREYERKRRKEKKEEQTEKETQLDLLKRENKLLRDSIKRLLEK